jgi:hypothetical protein
MIVAPMKKPIEWVAKLERMRIIQAKMARYPPSSPTAQYVMIKYMVGYMCKRPIQTEWS